MAKMYLGISHCSGPGVRVPSLRVSAKMLVWVEVDTPLILCCPSSGDSCVLRERCGQSYLRPPWLASFPLSLPHTPSARGCCRQLEMCPQLFWGVPPSAALLHMCGLSWQKISLICHPTATLQSGKSTDVSLFFLLFFFFFYACITAVAFTRGAFKQIVKSWQSWEHIITETLFFLLWTWQVNIWSYEVKNISKNSSFVPYEGECHTHFVWNFLTSSCSWASCFLVLKCLCCDTHTKHVRTSLSGF